MSTLITGYTWYGKYGFVPEDMELHKVFMKNAKIMKSLKLSKMSFSKRFDKKSIYKKPTEKYTY